MTPDSRIHVTLDHLRDLEVGARDLTFLPRQPSASVLNGRHSSHLRGRGLDFEEMRDYLPGDDIRSIDWKATARTGKPHVRVFTEERDRPALVVVDQRMSMFFGSRLNMKSTTAAEAAAIAAFRILDAGDRVGGIVFNDEKQREFAPRRQARTVYRVLESIVEMNSDLHADHQIEPTPGRLNQALKSVARIAHHDHLVLMFSDFDGIDETTHRYLSAISAHNDVILMLVHDPIARRLDVGEHTIIGDSRMQAELNLGSSSVREAVTAQSNRRLDRIIKWQTELNLSVFPMSAGDETLPQLRQLLGRLRPQRRVR